MKMVIKFLIAALCCLSLYLTIRLHFDVCFMLLYVVYVAVNVLVAYTDRNVYFIAWATESVSALCALFALFQTLLVATVSLMSCRTNKVID